VLWETLTGRIPFQDFKSNQIIQYVALLNWRLPLPEKRKPLGRLITQCWSKDLAEWPAFAEITPGRDRVRAMREDRLAQPERKLLSAAEYALRAGGPLTSSFGSSHAFNGILSVMP
jgi:hypothetical protein